MLNSRSEGVPSTCNVTQASTTRGEGKGKSKCGDVRLTRCPDGRDRLDGCLFSSKKNFPKVFRYLTFLLIFLSTLLIQISSKKIPAYHNEKSKQQLEKGSSKDVFSKVKRSSCIHVKKNQRRKKSKLLKGKVSRSRREEENDLVGEHNKLQPNVLETPTWNQKRINRSKLKRKKKKGLRGTPRSEQSRKRKKIPKFSSSTYKTNYDTEIPLITQDNSLCSEKIFTQKKKQEVLGERRPLSMSFEHKRNMKEIISNGIFPSKLRNRLSNSVSTKWIRKYLSAHREDVLLPVPRDFIVDSFNLQRLPEMFDSIVIAPFPSAGLMLFRAAIKHILDDDVSLSSGFALAHVEKAAQLLYPILHARFVVSMRGLAAVSKTLKYNGAVFGKCPRQFCKGVFLPCGISDQIGKGNCMRYCCSCGEVFFQWDSKVDGCAWGTSFCHLLLMMYGEELFPHLTTSINTTFKNTVLPNNAALPFPTSIPRIFGFRVHPSNSVINYPITKRIKCSITEKGSDATT